MVNFEPMNPLERTRIDAKIRHHEPDARRLMAACVARGDDPSLLCVMLTEGERGSVDVEAVAIELAIRVLADLGREHLVLTGELSSSGRLAREFVEYDVPDGHVLVVFNSRHGFGFVVTTIALAEDPAR